MQSKAATVEKYLAELPEDRRAAISAVRKVFLKNLDKGYTEHMAYGAIGYSVPHSTYPAGYHCDPKQPLPFAGLGSQKNHMSLGFMCLYGNQREDAAFRKAWAATGKKLDMGKCCIRFKRVEDLALDVIADVIRRITVKDFIAHYEKSLLTMNKAAAARKAARDAEKGAPNKKATAKKPVAPVKKKSASKASSRPRARTSR